MATEQSAPTPTAPVAQPAQPASPAQQTSQQSYSNQPLAYVAQITEQVARNQPHIFGMHPNQQQQQQQHVQPVQQQQQQPAPVQQSQQPQPQQQLPQQQSFYNNPHYGYPMPTQTPMYQQPQLAYPMAQQPVQNGAWPMVPTQPPQFAPTYNNTYYPAQSQPQWSPYQQQVAYPPPPQQQQAQQQQSYAPPAAAAQPQAPVPAETTNAAAKQLDQPKKETAASSQPLDPAIQRELEELKARNAKNEEFMQKMLSEQKVREKEEQMRKFDSALKDSGIQIDKYRTTYSRLLDAGDTESAATLLDDLSKFAQEQAETRRAKKEMEQNRFQSWTNKSLTDSNVARTVDARASNDGRGNKRSSDEMDDQSSGKRILLTESMPEWRRKLLDQSPLGDAAEFVNTFIREKILI